MLTPEERWKLEEILRNVREMTELIHEIKLWRKFILWAFGIVSTVVTVLDFAKYIGVIK